jgi:hypothetical protein
MTSAPLSTACIVQARVGYDQGPQVPHPAAPEYQPALAFAERFWQQIWHSQRQRGYPQTTLTPEFGADGYLHHLPFTNVPVADLWSLNAWMAARQQPTFSSFYRSLNRNRSHDRREARFY